MNYAGDTQSYLDELEKDIEKRFSIYNYTLRNSFKAHEDKISYMLNSIKIIEEKIKSIEEYNKKPWYKKIFKTKK